jgi:hypothetical protein
MKKRDTIMAIFWILLGLTISIWSATFPFGGLEDPGPAYFPTALGLIIIVIGMIMLFRARKEKEGNVLSPSEPPISHRASVMRVIFCLAGMTLSAVFFEILGFILTMFLMILFMMRTIDPQKWRKALFYSLISALGSLFVFRVLLKTQLPTGFFGF